MAARTCECVTLPIQPAHPGLFGSIERSHYVQSTSGSSINAERLRIREILTTDRHHFSLVRPRHCAAFTLKP